MERRLLFFERLMQAGGACCNCFLAISVDGPIDVETYRAALQRLRDIHPMLQLDVVERDGVPWFVQQKEPVPIPLRIIGRATDDDWQAELEHELNTGFPGGKGPLFRIVWLRGEDVSDFIFICHHCVGDGLTATMLARKSYNLALRPDFAVSGDSGISSLSDLIDEATLSNRRVRLRARLMALAARVLLPPLARLVDKGPPTTPNHAHRVLLDAETSKRLRAEAKRRDVPLFALFGAALALSFRELRGRKAGRRIVCAVDMRQALPKLSRHAMFALADSVTIEAPRADDIWDAAREFARAMIAKAQGADTVAKLIAGEWSHGVARALLRVVRGGGAKHDFVFAYLGTPSLPSFEPPNGFRTMLAGGASMPWRNSTTMSCFTVKASFCVVMVGRSPHLEPADAETIMEAFPRLMRGALA